MSRTVLVRFKPLPPLMDVECVGRVVERPILKIPTHSRNNVLFSSRLWSTLVVKSSEIWVHRTSYESRSISKIGVK